MLTFPILFQKRHAQELGQRESNWVTAKATQRPHSGEERLSQIDTCRRLWCRGRGTRAGLWRRRRTGHNPGRRDRRDNGMGRRGVGAAGGGWNPEVKVAEFTREVRREEDDEFIRRELVRRGIKIVMLLLFLQIIKLQHTIFVVLEIRKKLPLYIMQQGLLKLIFLVLGYKIML
ncbi:hypothetical protein M5689_012960 [Euphorbia peplus]|nr:hypothetical protein M5689_012960 [Euphorbia peplus]